MFRILASQILVDALPPPRNTRLIAVDDATGNTYYDGPAGWVPLGLGGGGQKFAAVGVSVPTTGTAEEVLRTYTLPGGTMATNGDRLFIRAVFSLAANANSKTMALKIGGIGGTLLALQTTTQNGSVVVLEATVYRTAPTTGDCYRIQFLTATFAQSFTGLAQIWANATDIVATATTATAAGDVTLRDFTVDYIKAPAV